jgi:hypothetical protein
VYPLDAISGRKSMNTVLNNTPTDILKKNNRTLSDTFFLINIGIAAIKDINETITTLIIEYNQTSNILLLG